jgi:dTDP-4-dehydrorhamnose reductase
LINLKKKILISGATGMLGQALLKEIATLSYYEIYYISTNNNKNYNIQKAELLTENEISSHQFYAYFHCAAEVDVNHCERDFNYAIRSNCDYVKLLFELVDAQFYFFISTDSVYDGKNGNYTEEDNVNPVNKYALSKLMGEEAAKRIAKNLYIIRTNIFGNNSKNKSSIFEWASSELLSGNRILGYNNISFNPLSVAHLSRTMLLMLHNEVQFGTYNLGCDLYMSKYEFLVDVAKLIGSNQSLIQPTEFKTSVGVANRPMNTTMSCIKIKNQIKNIDLSFETSLKLLSIIKV